MDRFISRTRSQAQQVSENTGDGRVAAEDPPEISGVDSGGIAGGGKLKLLSQAEATENPLPFMGMKVRRRACLFREFQGDYIDVPSDPYLSKLLRKHGDGKILFADKVLRFTSTGKMKSRLLLITDFAIYLINPDSDVLKRRIALAAVDKLCISELNDNFFAIIIPSEYDCLMASTRKTEIVNVLLEATKSTSQYELEVFRSNWFEYNAAADMVKEVEFKEVDGSVRARFRKKENQ